MGLFNLNIEDPGMLSDKSSKNSLPRNDRHEGFRNRLGLYIVFNVSVRLLGLYQTLVCFLLRQLTS